MYLFTKKCSLFLGSSNTCTISIFRSTSALREAQQQDSIWSKVRRFKLTTYVEQFDPYLEMWSHLQLKGSTLQFSIVEDQSITSSPASSHQMGSMLVDTKDGIPLKGRWACL